MNSRKASGANRVMAATTNTTTAYSESSNMSFFLPTFANIGGHLPVYHYHASRHIESGETIHGFDRPLDWNRNKTACK